MASRRKKNQGAGGASKRTPRAFSDVQALNTAIQGSGAGWSAGESEITSLAATHPAGLLGLHVSDEELQATANAIAAAEALQTFAAPQIAAPAKLDWRANGGNFVTSVKNQGGCGSCVSFATIGTIEARMNVACRRTNAAPDLSEAHLFYCGCGNCCGTGWNFAPALNFCKSTGFALESSFPYTPANQPCKSGVPIAGKITGFTTALSAADRRNAIASGGPVVAGMAVYQDFFAYRSGVYRHVSGGLAGYHAVSVVGYDDAGKFWIAKNSWGTGWGEAGFFKIAYGDSGIDTQFAFYVPQVPCPVDTCTRYRPFLFRVLALARTNPALRACLRYHVCGRGRRPVCSPAIVACVRTVLAVLRVCPRYRPSFCTVLG